MVKRIVLIAGTIILLAFSAASAGEVTLGWNPIPGAEGYHIYQRLEGQAYDYKKPAWTGAGVRCTIKGLVQGRVYHFVARAFAKDQKSSISKEVTYRAPGQAPGKTKGVSLSND